jgi:hypothetical protein
LGLDLGLTAYGMAVLPPETSLLVNETARFDKERHFWL